MDQLWCYFYTCAKHPTMDLIRYPNQLEVKHMRQLLGILYTHGVDWTDPSAWPEDFVEGKWERQIPLPFLLENIGSGRNASMRIISAFCEGELLPASLGAAEDLRLIQAAAKTCLLQCSGSGPTRCGTCSRHVRACWHAVASVGRMHG